jgi:hypothetical protein
MRKGSQGKELLFERKKNPVPRVCQGWGQGFLPQLIFYPLELLHFLHKTEMLSKVLRPPWAIDNI